MRLLGFYPPHRFYKLYKIYALLIYCSMTVPVPTLATIYLLSKEQVTLAEISNSAFLICQVGCFIAKFVPFWKNDNRIRRNIELLEEPIFVDHGTKQQIIVADCVRKNNRNCFLNLLLVLTAFISWALMPLLKNNGDYKLPIEVWLPYNVTADLRLFGSTYVFVLSGVGNGAIASGVIDPLIAGLAYYATGQLKILKYNLQYLDYHVNEKILTSIDVRVESREGQYLKGQIMYETIQFCVKHHNAIIRYVEDFENTYSFVVFVQFTASVLVICNACLQLSMVQPFTYAFFQMVSFLLTMLAEVFLYSYYGTTLFEESNTLTDAIYMSDWYNYNSKCKKALIILMERSKKPITVTAGKILDLSLVTFTTILRRAYSLLAVLKNY